MSISTETRERIMRTALRAGDREGRNPHFVRVRADGYAVAEISSAMNDREAYGRLFAAAPAMLRVLRLCMDRDDLMADDDELGALIRYAVACAEGEA